MDIFEMKKLCYGGDYNPEQWLGYDGVWDEDIRMMKKALINCVTLGVFSWSMLEKREGEFDFTWLDDIMDKLYRNGIYVILATPSGARPPWLAAKYPEVLRTDPFMHRHRFGRRHNHCLTSPVYREKSSLIAEKLSERYGKHPAVIMWHISNEFSGDCRCESCAAAFRRWLKAKYNNDLDLLNHEWWGAFWSHIYTDWSQIDPPTPMGECSVHGQNLDWHRFVSDMTISFFDNEVKAVRKHSQLPVTTNLMAHEGLDYYSLAEHTDMVTWDCYPQWHNNGEPLIDTAHKAAFLHDLYRSMKQKPFLMLESTPSLVNWSEVNKLKAPGMNILSSMQAVAHGSDGAMFFQIRKSRGAGEKFHGAVIDHCGHENTRVFREVEELGKILEGNAAVKGSFNQSDAAVIYEFENAWAISDLQGLKKERGYRDTCIEHYAAVREYGINVDVISVRADLSRYKVICAPMCYIMREETAGRLRRFVKGGGILIATYLTAYVNENDLCHLGGFPGYLKDVFGILNEEIDSLYGSNAIIAGGMEYEVKDFCERIHPDPDTEILGIYKSDFYAGEPAITRHSFGKGTAFYIAARTERAYLKKLYADILSGAGIKPIADSLGSGVSVTRRGDNIFIMNFTDKENTAVYNGSTLTLAPYECLVK